MFLLALAINGVLVGSWFLGEDIGPVNPAWVLVGFLLGFACAVNLVYWKLVKPLLDLTMPTKGEQA